MKKFLILATLALVSVSALAGPPVTNSIGVPALVFATTPLAGTERVPIYQSGLKSATVAQIAAAASAVGSAAQSYALAASNSLAATLSQATNNLALLSKSVAANSTNFNFFSNAAAATLNGLGSLSRSNSLTMSAIADAGSIAIRGSNDFYLASNPSNFQSGSQVSSTVSAAIAAGGAATNGGSVRFNTLVLPSLFLPDVNYSAQTNYALDCSKACNFVLTEKSVGGSFLFSPTITNFSEGQQIQLLIKCGSGSVTHSLVPVTAILPGFKFLGSASSIGMGVGDTAFLNWLIMGTNIIYSGGKL